MRLAAGDTLFCAVGVRKCRFRVKRQQQLNNFGLLTCFGMYSLSIIDRDAALKVATDASTRILPYLESRFGKAGRNRSNEGGDESVGAYDVKVNSMTP